ncbi:MAG: hypothetical protein KAJ75_08925 [Alphaproteobacteria bacterium]|nr:hypothetical protein [Alphaproteobacteria bacterium]
MALNGVSGTGSWQAALQNKKISQVEQIHKKNVLKTDVKTADNPKIEEAIASSKSKAVPSYDSRGGSSSIAPKGSTLDILV